MSKHKHTSPRSLWKNFLNVLTDEFFRKLSDLARNTKNDDECWCGSGKKYRSCHLTRIQEPLLTTHQYVKVLRRAFDRGQCLHPQTGPSVCQGGIIKSHSLQKNGVLSLIARGSHVYTFLSQKNMSSDSLAKPALLSVGKASTFTGFCHFHDNNTFLPLESCTFQSTQQQTVLLSYRALCLELFKKRMSLNFALPLQQENLDKGRSLDDQMHIQYQLSQLICSSLIGMADLYFYKEKYDKALIDEKYDDISFYTIFIDRCP